MKINMTYENRKYGENTIKSVKEDIEIVKKFDNDKVDINFNKGEVVIASCSNNRITSYDSESTRLIHAGEVSYDTETGNTKYARITSTEEAPDGYMENSYINGYSHATGGGEFTQTGVIDVKNSLRESKYEEREEGFFNTKTVGVYTQYRDGHGGLLGPDTYTKVKVEKETGRIIDVERKEGFSARMKGKLEFDITEEKRDADDINKPLEEQNTEEEGYFRKLLNNGGAEKLAKEIVPHVVHAPGGNILVFGEDPYLDSLDGKGWTV